MAAGALPGARPRARPPLARPGRRHLIEIACADPAWPRRFEEERALLEPVLAPWLAGAIEHVGSTAVPGLAAKPVIDLMAPVRSLAEAAAAIEPLGALGYLHWPYRPWMHWFCKPSAEVRTHHLHLVEPGHPKWEERLAFRDTLRAEPETAAAYERLKRELAARHPSDREAYTEAKSAFVTAVVARALGRVPDPA